MNPTFTIGIEEEYQTVDPVTRDLRSHIHAEIIEKGKLILQERVKAEMHASVVEVGTSVCDNIKDCKHEVKKLRRDMIALAKENGLRLASAATHPFADWRVQDIYPHERHKNIAEERQLGARWELIFGLQVHNGAEERENAIHMMKQPHYFRPHPFFNTIEFRICDIPMRMDETITLAALIQATVAKLYKLYEANQGFRLYRRALIMENKWRAARYGINGKMIDFGKQIQVPVRDLILEYLKFVDDVVDELGSREEIEYVHKILEMGTGADRQIR